MKCENLKVFRFVTKKTEEIPDSKNSFSEKRQAFLHMEELKKKYLFPKDYDYEQVRREAMGEKYGRTI